MDTNLTTLDAHASKVLASDAHLGVTHLTVGRLDRSLPFYVDGLGLQVLGRDEHTASLGAGDSAILQLTEDPDARPAGRHAGLFHAALLYPSRVELARVAQRLITHRIPIEGASDHGTHEAFYLSDPDGNGLELAADRPRDVWPDPQLEYIRGPQPLDVRNLMSLVADTPVARSAEPGLQVGHMHLHVGDIDEAIHFYRDIIGFEVQAQLPTAAFVSVGGYHHHLGLNIWKGQGVPPVPQHVFGMRYWTLNIPDTRNIDALVARLDEAGVTYDQPAANRVVVSDPWANQLRVELHTN